MAHLKEWSKQYLDGEMDGFDYLSLLIHYLERAELSNETIELAWRLYADNTSMGEYVTFVARRRMT